MSVERRVFLSHIHEEKEIAAVLKGIIDTQIGNKVYCFLSDDRFQTRAGENWLDRIKTEPSKANVVILMLSEQSVRRHWVHLEAGAAWIMGRTVMPVYYSGLLLFIVGKETWKSRWVRWEVEKAVELEKRIIAVKVEKNCKTPDALLRVGATWALSFNFAAIKNAIKDAYNN